MEVKEQISRYLITEYTLTGHPNRDKLKEWNKIACELMIKIINGRQFTFYINNYKNKSYLKNFSSFTTGNLNGINYGILSLVDITFLSEFIEESEFYLGEIYLLIGEVSESNLQDFIHYLNFQNKVCYSPNIECIRMDNDGESIFWITPLKKSSTTNIIRDESKIQNG